MPPMLDAPTALSDWERDKLKLDFAVWLAKRARRFHVNAEQIVDVIVPRDEIRGETNQIHIELRGSDTTNVDELYDQLAPAFSDTALTPAPEGESPPGSPSSISPETATKLPGGEPANAGGENEALTRISIAGTAGSDDGAVAGETDDDVRRADASEIALGRDVESVTTVKPGGDPSSSAPRIPVQGASLLSRVRAIHAAHPDWTSGRVHRELPGSNLNSVAGYLTQVRKEAPPAPRQRPASAHPPARAPEAASTPEPPPAPIRPPVAASPSSGSAVVSKPMVKPKGTRFYLRNDQGLYLHYGCENMTTDKAYAWQGTADQLLACRKKFELARDLAEQVVEKEAKAAA